MKCLLLMGHLVLLLSPPSRGAWIEILVLDISGLTPAVAPLAGGVD